MHECSAEELVLTLVASTFIMAVGWEFIVLLIVLWLLLVLPASCPVGHLLSFAVLVIVVVVGVAA